MSTKAKEVKTKEVKVYSTPTCPWCHKAKHFLEANGVKYQDLNVAEDQQALEDMTQKSGQMGVPVIEVGKDIIIGFDEQKLREKLGL